MNINKIRILNGNILKILAAIFMVIDHVGLMFFPYSIGFRIVGRLAFPIFAFMISEGARYTKNKPKYLITISLLALICQLVYFFFANSLYMCILVTFSLSIIVIYSLSYFKKCLFSEEAKNWEKLFSGALFLFTVFAVAVLNRLFDIDYGFLGCMAPAFASLFDFRGIDVPKSVAKTDNLYVRVASFGVGILLLAISSGGIQFYSLLALILLLLYSGERGKAKMKYFFYLFYPLHLVALTAVQIIISIM